jgi:hypothetical protein
MVDTLLDPEVIEHSIVGYDVTAGAAEQTLPISLDGSAPAASVAIGAGVIMLINEFAVAGEDPGESRFRLQQSNNAGVAWFDIALARVGFNDTNPQEYETPIRVVGGVGVLLRVRVETVGGAFQVAANARANQMTVNAA